jgi:predicted SprT family Zn-dependent metalloprotease
MRLGDLEDSYIPIANMYKDYALRVAITRGNFTCPHFYVHYDRREVYGITHLNHLEDTIKNRHYGIHINTRECTTKVLLMGTVIHELIHWCAHLLYPEEKTQGHTGDVWKQMVAEAETNIGDGCPPIE